MNKGLAYYLSPPRDLSDVFKDPIHLIAYMAFVLSVCGIFARYWVEISGESATDVAKKYIYKSLSK